MGKKCSPTHIYNTHMFPSRDPKKRARFTCAYLHTYITYSTYSLSLLSVSQGFLAVGGVSKWVS